MICGDKQNAAHLEEWSLGDPLINSQWACVRKALAGEGCASRADSGKPVLRPVSDWWLEEIKRNSRHVILQTVTDRVAL
jgi:hypothetical protein